MKTYVVTGAASGIGAATTALLREQGHRVITVDRHETDVVGDLSTAAGRRSVIATVRGATDVLHGIVPCAGIAGISGTDAQVLVSVNYFGAVEVVEGLRDLLVAGASPESRSAVILLSSNSTTCQPGWSARLAKACLSGRGPCSVAHRGDPGRLRLPRQQGGAGLMDPYEREVVGA